MLIVLNVQDLLQLVLCVKLDNCWMLLLVNAKLTPTVKKANISDLKLDNVLEYAQMVFLINWLSVFQNAWTGSEIMVSVPVSNKPNFQDVHSPISTKTNVWVLVALDHSPTLSTEYVKLVVQIASHACPMPSVLHVDQDTTWTMESVSWEKNVQELNLNTTEFVWIHVPQELFNQETIVREDVTLIHISSTINAMLNVQLQLLIELMSPVSLNVHLAIFSKDQSVNFLLKHVLQVSSTTFKLPLVSNVNIHVLNVNSPNLIVRLVLMDKFLEETDAVKVTHVVQDHTELPMDNVLNVMPNVTNVWVQLNVQLVPLAIFSMDSTVFWDYLNWKRFKYHKMPFQEEPIQCSLLWVSQ